MIQGITKDMHVFADYSYIPMVLLAPRLMGFEQDRTSAMVCRSFALAELGTSLLTDAKWGAIRCIPYKTHAIIDLASGVMALAAAVTKPIASNKPARNTLIMMGITGLVVGTLSIIGAKRG
ncbi:hypothetical protein GCM10011387_16650 [Pedobacter quisquiliarum]|uniref:Uncharacterized protein n=1 Tax=Pedobacter quisquiliarum TaxID=1834438 RepID=A0A916U7P7_9SPHI|nr:hypothetical protein [Pedobacter quisquiliarum]GGC63672.1 hypothetical protein GCM10011387_16650 [Pedobacter quisquiliarum]